MTKAHVTVHGPNADDEREFEVQVNGEGANFEIKADKLEATFGKLLDNRLSDFLDIASSIFAADNRVGRGTMLRAGFGRSWRRRMRIRFSVREPDFWNQAEVKAALADAVAFMSDDTLELEFEQASKWPAVQGILDLGSHGPVFSADEVILFSGGLDSLAGAYERLSTAPGKIILLSHISANKRIGYAKNLVDRLRKTFPGRILWVPVTAHLKGVRANETTQRTRSLLFACLGLVTAKLSGARCIHFYENGIVSANLPISAQVIGTMASRTTHPQTLKLLGALLDTITPGEVVLANGYGTLTKAEVARRLADLGGADLIRHSVSCSHVREQTILHPHCGACSQCLDRRFGILAAGLASHDPAEGYEIDVLTDARPKDDQRVLALDWSRHALRLAEISDSDFVAGFGSELARLVAGQSELPAAEHARSIVSMHRTHGFGVRDAISHAIKVQADAIVKQSLPETSLLRMIVADMAALPATVGTTPYSVPDIESNNDAEPIRSAQKVRIVGSPESATVTIPGIGEVAGVNATPAWALKPQHATDRKAALDFAQYKFVTGGSLATALGISKPSLRQRVKRLREDLADQFEAIEGFRFDQPILIQSRGSRDYRLTPEMDIEE